MTFPQTSPIDATKRGQEYWRLYTTPESSGDIWESDVGARAFTIGAQSDIARAAVTYIDPQGSGGGNQIEFSTLKPLVGRVDAAMDGQYPARIPSVGGVPQPYPGRLLITLKDLLPPPGWVPAVASGTVFVNVTQPLIDIYQFLSDEPAYFGPRADRYYRYTFGKSALLTFTTLWFAVPFYGRRFAKVTSAIVSGVATAGQITVYGVNFTTVQDVPGATINPTIQIAQSAGGGAAPNQVATAREEAYDYLAVSVVAGGIGDPVAITILLSDELG